MLAKSILLTLFLFVIIIGLGVGSANAVTENFTVPSQSKVTRSLSLKENDRVSISFTVVGQSTNELNFYITDPNGNAIMQEKVGQITSSFSAKMTGTYTLHFDNSLSSESKTVMLNYDVQHYIMGLPQTMFLVIVIAVVLVIALAVFVLMGKSTY